MRAYRTVQRAARCEIVINRSRFIGRCFPVQSEGEALAFLNDIRKENWDASHHCFAYRIGETGAIARYSDDGEPGGTAGKPIMDVLMGKALVNTLVVVTRYFGGVLLGAGGLVRAYSRSAAEAAEQAEPVCMQPGTELTVTLSYARYQAAEPFLRARAQIISCDFAEEVTLRVMADAAQAEALIAAITEKTDGRAVICITGAGYFAQKT